MNKVYRIFVEKREQFAVEAKEVLHTLKTQLKIEALKDLKVVNRYDVQGVNEEALKEGISIILSEPMVDDVILEDYKNAKSYDDKAVIFGIEYLPGQYDQRADACEQCFQLLTGEKNVKVKCAKIIVLYGDLANDDVLAIQKYLINPVDQRLASLEKVTDLTLESVEIKPVDVFVGFTKYDDVELKEFLSQKQMAMNIDDLKMTQEYFKNDEKRDPTETEIRVLDTYWSDHCRHTTFSTVITDIQVGDGEFKEVLAKDLDNYKASRHAVYGFETKRPITLMDLATISMKELRKKGYLNDLEVSEEINACSIEIKIKTANGEEDWL